MKHVNKRIAFVAMMLGVALVGCSQPVAPQNSTMTNPGALMDTPSQDPASATLSPTSEQTAVLYVGTKSDGFAEYPIAFEGKLTPELLIQGIADLTGWDLTLAEPVTTGKGGMSICLGSESALFTGPPNPQKEEFHMYDVGQLAETILDSIQKTLQIGFTGEGGDPDALDIYYYMEGDQPLEVPNLGLSWPIDIPYQWSAAESK